MTIKDNENAKVFRSRLSQIFQLYSDIFIPQHIENVKRYLDSAFSSANSERHFTPDKVKNMIFKYSSKKFVLITAEVAKCLPKKYIITLNLHLQCNHLTLVLSNTMEIFTNNFV